nr:hypothetical protein [uncultured Allomuricauda sp.]
MERLEWYYSQNGGEIEIFIDGETRRVSNVNFDTENKKLIIY